jgi:hypothetical protein
MCSQLDVWPQRLQNITLARDAVRRSANHETLCTVEHPIIVALNWLSGSEGLERQ